MEALRHLDQHVARALSLDSLQDEEEGGRSISERKAVKPQNMNAGGRAVRAPHLLVRAPERRLVALAECTARVRVGAGETFRSRRGWTQRVGWTRKKKQTMKTGEKRRSKSRDAPRSDTLRIPLIVSIERWGASAGGCLRRGRMVGLQR